MTASSTGRASGTDDEPPRSGAARAVIEDVTPRVDAGRFAVKRVVGDRVDVEADCFADGHDVLACVLRFRRESDDAWQEAPMVAIGNDRWRGSFLVDAVGRYRYTVCAWVDAFLSWRHDFERRVDPDDLRSAALVGAELIGAAAKRARGDDRRRLAAWAQRLSSASATAEVREIALDPGLADLAARHPDRGRETCCAVDYPLVVDRKIAAFASWYEFFPRSTGASPGVHGTFRDAEAMLAYVAGMGFDVVYLPPIHPIGRERRKGRNNTLAAGPGEVGSPWAIGAREGGHRAVHPDLGTLDDFRRFLAKAAALGLEVAIDIAFQCAPDHPYVAEHPEWFRHRPDGSVQYAENPPKKYQDIYPFHFEGDDWPALWRELAGVMAFWLDQGVRTFRVDNPHTKPFPFWEWAIAKLKRVHPDAIFLAEAFTRPKVMHRLAKLGFTQSYTYFAWRTTKREIEAYFTELNDAPGRDYFRPNCWPNTPDILPETLQVGGRPAFMARVFLAATLSALYGIYGPAFELLEHVPREPGSEEYLDSEKYELKRWDLGRPESLAPFIARLNAARRDQPSLGHGASLAFLPTDNDALIAYARASPDRGDVALAVVNLDPHHRQSGWVTFDPTTAGLEASAPFQVHDLMTDARYLWQGTRHYVELDPARVPAHLFVVRRRVRTERDFDYFL